MIDGSPASREISLTIRWLWGLSSWLSNNDSTVSTFSSVWALRLPLPGRLSTVANFTSSLFMLFVAQLLFRLLYTAERCNLYLHIDFKILLNGVKVGAFAWYSVKIGVIFGVQFERQKVEKKQTYIKTETCKLYSRVFLNISAKCHQNPSLEFWAILLQIWAIFETM